MFGIPLPVELQTTEVLLVGALVERIILQQYQRWRFPCEARLEPIRLFPHPNLIGKADWEGNPLLSGRLSDSHTLELLRVTALSSLQQGTTHSLPVRTRPREVIRFVEVNIIDFSRGVGKRAAEPFGERRDLPRSRPLRVYCHKSPPELTVSDETKGFSTPTNITRSSPKRSLPTCAWCTFRRRARSNSSASYDVVTVPWLRVATPPGLTGASAACGSLRTAPS